MLRRNASVLRREESCCECGGEDTTGSRAAPHEQGADANAMKEETSASWKDGSLVRVVAMGSIIGAKESRVVAILSRDGAMRSGARQSPCTWS